MRFWHVALLLIEGAVSLAFAVLDPEPQKVCGTVVNTLNNTVVVRDLYDRSSHTGRVGPATAIRLDGRPATLTDLKTGDFVQMMVGSPNDPLVSSIEAKALERPQQLAATTRQP